MKKQIFKRTLALLLCVALIFSLSSVSFAKNMELSKSSSLSTLRSQFNRAKGPKTNGKVIEYSYFSPLKTKSDTKKYPLIIYLPGQGHGKKSGDELKAYSFALWSSKEFQKRVNAGGAYLMAAKSLGSKGEWNSTSLIAPLKAAIDDFLRKNPNVDKSKIVLMGNSYGANGVINFSAKYGSFVKTAVIMSPTKIISKSTAKSMKNVRTWLIAAKGDSFYPYNIALKPSYNNLKSKGAKGVEKVLVTLNKAPNAAAILKHNSWELVFHDFDKTGLKGYDSWTISSSTRGSLPKNSSAIKEFTR